jgi:hypothetical protein
MRDATVSAPTTPAARAIRRFSLIDAPRVGW